ncbi:clathrin adaptor complex small chain-domain-containing protein [Lophiotrema nucula]|uniref:AP-1 complex subunit sigma-1 n=1 Tax=Lophiotrema nucula TaxID=690887 RepID=A0A6A5ZUW8_9PLEO|nr:clathrin adaptor complex small chain-domain-containing protein [Lophiotrema nucula]
MAIKYLILLSRQGKVRLAKWFTTLAPKDKAKIVKDVSQLVLARRARMCNFLEYKDTKIVYRRYASLFFIAGCDSTDNELITLEIVHRYVEQMDKYYGNVCELDIIFNFQKAYFILDELLLAGELQESSKKNVLRCIGQQDSLEDMEYLDLCAVLHDVDRALNFDTQDSTIIGGVDIWTTKAAGDDKKLYKRIERILEERHRDVLAAVADMPAKSLEQFADEFNLDRNTVFGSFKEPANRHKFAYMIATLNATHVDYDYANTCNPDEFRRETKEGFMQKIDTTMYYLRPQAYSAGLPSGAMTPLGSPIWSQQSWQRIDSEMNLNDCEYYSWVPSEDPYADDGAIWSYHFLIYNKERKRVAYFYLRGISALSSSPAYPMSLISKFKQSKSEQSANEGSRKRAEYWLGDRAKRGLEYGSPDELDNLVIDHPGEVVDADDVVDYRDRETSIGFEYVSEDDSDVESLYERERSQIRDRERSAAVTQESHETRQKSSSVPSMGQHLVDRMEL